MDVVDTIPVVGPVVGAGKDLAEFVETGFGRRILMDTPHMKVVLVAFLPGQRIPDHAPAVDLAVSVLEGDGRVRIDDQEFGVRAGDVAMIPAGAARSITAGSAGMVALHVVSPPPTAADHATAQPPLPRNAPTLSGGHIAEAVAREHVHLRPIVESLGDLADNLGDMSQTDRADRLAKVASFLREDLLSHARAEEDTIYPMAEMVLRARGGAIGTMLLGHEAITALVEELEDAISAEEIDAMPRILHSLRAVILLHLEEEEAVYLPALIGLSEAETVSLAGALGIES